MSKTILVIDTPQTCSDCLLLYEAEFDGTPYEYRCNLLYEKNLSIDEVDIKKPDWCPLKDVPDKYEPVTMNFERGWNSCIDEILKRENGNE